MHRRVISSTYILGKEECKITVGAMSNLGSLAADYATSSSDEDDSNNLKQKGSSVQGAYVKELNKFEISLNSAKRLKVRRFLLM